MRFNNPIPRSGLPRFHESSPQRSPRDSDATQRLWQKHRDAGKQAQANSLAIENLQRQVARLRLRRSASETVGHPFKIKRGSTWLKFIVGDGMIITTGDVIDPILDIGTELILTAGVAKYWIYIEMTATDAGVLTSATTPTWDSSKVPIGYVDTDTYEADERSVIKQFTKTNIYNPCV